MKIIILGAGVGGLAAARYLTAAGHEVELYEQAPALRTEGAALILWSSGTGILQDIGVGLDGLGSRMDEMDTCLDDGSPVLRMRLRKIEGRLGAPTVVVPRGRLVEVLAGGLDESVVHFGKRCVDVVEPAEGSSDPVTAVFEDGSRAQGDILIAADGHRSNVRRKLVGPAQARATGYATWHGLTKVPIELSNANRMLAIYGKAGFSTLFSAGDGLLQWVFVTPWSDGDTVPPGTMDPSFQQVSEGAPSPIRNLRERFGTWMEPIPELLDIVTDHDISVYPHILHDVPKRWGRGRVLMMGDAVHAVPPTLAQGVNQTLEDAWALKRAFAESPSPDAVLDHYEGSRSKRMRKLSKLAARSENRPAPPRFLRFAPSLIPQTRMNQWAIKNFSTYLNDPVAKRAGSRT